MEEMANDVAPFLFHSKDVKQVLFFEDYLKQIKI